MPRGAGTAPLMLGIVVLALLVTVVVLAGITSQYGGLKHPPRRRSRPSKAGWLKDLGVDPCKAKSANKDASSSASDAVKALLQGLGTGVKELSSLIFFLALTALSLLFLLKDGPTIRARGERHLGVPLPVARIIGGRSLQSLRGYFLGVTMVAAFNAVVVFLGALLLGTIAAVTFLAGSSPISAPGPRRRSPS